MDFKIEIGFYLEFRKSGSLHLITDILLENAKMQISSGWSLLQDELFAFAGKELPNKHVKIKPLTYHPTSE